MMYLLLATIFFVLWYVADKQLRARFNPYLKWGSLAIIFFFVFYDTFMFIETQRLLSVSGGSNINNLSSANSCLGYITSMPCSLLTMVVNSGTLSSGSSSSLIYVDNQYVTVMMHVGSPAYELDINTSCPSDIILFKGRSDTPNNEIDIYSSGTWNNVYAFSNSTSDYQQQINISNFKNTSSGIVQLRIFSNDAGASPLLNLNVDQLTTLNTVSTSAYCYNTQDTADILAYHQTEDAIIPQLFWLLPYLAFFVIVLLGIQVLMIMYDNAMNPRGEADDVIGTDKSSKENLLARRNKEQSREYR